MIHLHYLWIVFTGVLLIRGPAPGARGLPPIASIHSAAEKSSSRKPAVPKVATSLIIALREAYALLLASPPDGSHS